MFFPTPASQGESNFLTCFLFFERNIGTNRMKKDRGLGRERDKTEPRCRNEAECTRTRSNSRTCEPLLTELRQMMSIRPGAGH